ncbi:MAG: iron-containing redox enzyme family protein [Myxococcales bacterium]|nr:iron-containing redox enzyme family protein [Myxococcales bacterium]
MDIDALATIRARVLSGIRDTGIIERVATEGDPEAGRATYARYLTNVWHYAQHSPRVIALAGSRATSTHPRLAEYLFRHAQEELGHEAWALEDLAKLGVTETAVRATRPVPACAAMIGFEYYIAGYANPVGLFGWLYVLEAMGDDLGHVVAERLQASQGDGVGVKFIGGHGEADKEHTAEIVEHLREHTPTDDAADVEFVADVVGDLYVRMFAEIGRS